MAGNYVFKKFFYGKGEDQEEAWENASPRLDVDYDEVYADDYANLAELEAEERIAS